MNKYLSNLTPLTVTLIWVLLNEMDNMSLTICFLYVTVLTSKTKMLPSRICPCLPRNSLLPNSAVDETISDI